MLPDILLWFALGNPIFAKLLAYEAYLEILLETILEYSEGFDKKSGLLKLPKPYGFNKPRLVLE